MFFSRKYIHLHYNGMARREWITHENNFEVYATQLTWTILLIPFLIAADRFNWEYIFRNIRFKVLIEPVE